MNFDVVTSQHGSFNGTISVDNNARIDGGFEGIINAGDTVVVGINGTVKGEIHAYNVIVAGKVEGTLVCDGKLLIEKTGDVTGNISIAGVEVQEGGCLSGVIVRIAKRAVAPVAQNAAQQEATATADASAHVEVSAPKAAAQAVEKAEPAPKKGLFARLSMACLTVFAMCGCIYFF